MTLQAEILLQQHDKFFKTGKTLDVRFRIETLKLLKKNIEIHEGEITLALKNDFGKSEFESVTNETSLVINEIKSHIRNLKKWSALKRVKTPLYLFPSKSGIQRQPLGNVLIISPFNYPFMLALMPLTGAVSAGNTVVLKPSELTPATSAVISKIIRQTVSDDYITVVEGGVEETQQLLAQRWDFIFFTGSTRVGKIVMEAAARNLTPVVLELGGKNPVVVDRDANPEIAAQRIVWGKILNGGQSCVGPDYVFVHEELKERFLACLKKSIENMLPGNIENNPDYCRMVSQRSVERLAELMSGSKIFTGGNYNVEKCFFEPTVITDIPENSRALGEEIFGPLLPVLTFNDLGELLKTFREQEKPLSIYYFSENRKKQKKFILETFSGDVSINDTVIYLTNLNLPFGGVGHSGMGNYHGKRSFEIFSHERSVFITPTLFDIPLRYPPYAKWKLAIIKWFLR